MKNKIVVLLTALMTTALLVACGSSDVAENTQATTVETMLETEPTETVAETESTEMVTETESTEMVAETELTETTAELTDVRETTSTEAAHEHAYTKTITTEVTCETDGEVLFTCECGDSYTESVKSTGHSFEAYISNNDATYTADGTETATCICGETDTRTAEGSMLAYTYTYTDMDATMYVQKTVNVRNIPNTDGEKLGSLSTNEEVKVTGQCTETSWYRIEYSGGVAYVSDSYLGNDKVVVEQPKTEQTAQNTSSEFPYQLWTMYDDGQVAWFYMPENHGYPDAYNAVYEQVSAFNRSHWGNSTEGLIACDNYCLSIGSTGNPAPGNYYTEWRVDGKRIQRYFAW